MYLFTSAAEGSISDGNWARHRSASLACVASDFSWNASGIWWPRQRDCVIREALREDVSFKKKSTVTWIQLNVSWFSYICPLRNMSNSNVVIMDWFSWRDEEVLYVQTDYYPIHGSLSAYVLCECVNMCILWDNQCILYAGKWFTKMETTRSLRCLHFSFGITAALLIL